MLSSNNLKLITLFSVIIIVLVLPGFFINFNWKKDNAQYDSIFLQNKISPPASPLLKEITKDKQIIYSASQSGTVICTKEDPSLCGKDQENRVLEYNVGCTASNESASSIYICKNGRWIYADWTDHGWCNFCKGK